MIRSIKSDWDALEKAHAASNDSEEVRATRKASFWLGAIGALVMIRHEITHAASGAQIDAYLNLLEEEAIEHWKESRGWIDKEFPKEAS